MSEQAQAVPGFDVTTFTHQARTYQVFRAGDGPAVVVLHEIPGLHPGVIDFGRRLVDAGFTVYMPSLFGRPGAPYTTGATVRALAQVCVAREFTLLADRTSPVAHWLRPRALRVRRSRRRCGRHVLHRRVRVGNGRRTLGPRPHPQPTCPTRRVDRP